MEEKMTLAEMATKYMLQQMDPRLRWFTAGAAFGHVCVRGWTVRPTFFPDMNDWNFGEAQGGSCTTFTSLNHLLTLEEYEDENGIDYSRCIVLTATSTQELVAIKRIDELLKMVTAIGTITKIEIEEDRQGFIEGLLEGRKIISMTTLPVLHRYDYLARARADEKLILEEIREGRRRESEYRHAARLRGLHEALCIFEAALPFEWVRQSREER